MSRGSDLYRSAWRAAGRGWIGIQRFYGRGFVQLTFSKNYQIMDTLLGLGGKLLANPDLALEVPIAAKIIAIGMRDGKFTGMKLADYIPPGKGDKRDFVNARRIVNGMDDACPIAKRAEKYAENILGTDYMKSTLGASNPRILKQGMSGEQVGRLQDFMVANGVLDHKCLEDGGRGIFGNKTRMAVEALQDTLVKRGVLSEKDAEDERGVFQCKTREAAEKALGYHS